MLLPPLALLLAALMPAPAPVQTDPAIAARCEVARSVIAEELTGRERPVVIVSHEGFGSTRISLTQFLRHWTEEKAPARDLAAGFLAKPHIDLLTACPDLPRTLAGEDIAFGEAEVTAMMERSLHSPDGRPSTFYTSDVMAYSLPVVSGDGQSALAHFSISCGALCGVGSVVYFKRDADGAWQRVSIRRSWIS